MVHQKRSLPVSSSLIVISLFLVLMLSAPIVALSQNNTTATFVGDIIQAARQACENIQRGEVCPGSTPITVADAAGSESTLDTVGDVLATSDVASLTSPAADQKAKTWGIAYVRLGAGLPDDGESAVTMVALGDTTVSNAAVAADSITVCVGKNLNSALLNVFSGPGIDRPIIGALAELEKVPVNGRNSAGSFFRIQRGALLGWVSAENVAIDCDASQLVVGEEGDVSVLYVEPMQSFTVETAAQSSVADAPNGLLVQSPLAGTAHLLVNGVQLDLSGAAYITATKGDALSVRGLQGTLNISADGSSVAILPGFVSQVPLTDLVAAGAPSDPEAVADIGNQLDLLNSLVYGQSYGGAGSTTSNFSIISGPDPLAVDDMVRFNLRYSGDAAKCPVIERPLLDVVFAIDASNTMAGSKLDATRAAIGRFVASMNSDTDQVGMIAFGGQATAISPLTVNLSAAVNKLQDIKTENARAIDIGLAAAYSALKSGRGNAASRAIILVTAGSSDATLASQVATTIKNAGIRIITIGIGDGVNAAQLQAIASTEDSLLASSAVNVSDVVEASLLKLTQPVAVRNLKVSFKVDTKQFAVVEDLLAAAGGTFKGDTVSWDVPAVWNSQTVDFTTVLKALKSGNASPGTLNVSFSVCDAGRDTSQVHDIPAPPVTVATKAAAFETATLNGGFLTDNLAGTGKLAAYGQQIWGLNASDAQTVSVTTSGTQAPLSALLTGADGTVIEPLYTLPSAGGDEGDLSVFFVPKGGISWLYLRSDSPNAAGSYDINVSTGAGEAAAQKLVADGEPVADEQPQGEGQIYDVAGKPGDTLTFRYLAQGNAPLDSPLRLFSLDGQLADDVFTQYDATTNEWVSLQTLQGSGPYRVLVRSTTPYSLGVESGDTLTNTRGAIALGETRTTDAKNSKPSVFSYDLNVPDDKVVSIVLSGSATQSVVRNADNKVVALNDLLAVNDFKVNFYNLGKGSYTVLVPAKGAFRISVQEGDVTRALKGALSIGQTRTQALAANERFAAYNIVEGLGKPLVEGNLVTVTLDAENVSNDNVYIESFDGVRSVLTINPINDVVDRRTKRLIGVHELKGVGPYRVIVTNITNFVVRLDKGDLLTNNKGSIVVGQTLRDSSRAPQYLIYTLAPELGKQLVEGDIVTLNFLNQANTEKPFFDPFLRDGKENAIPSQVVYQDEDARRFIAVYQLVGAPPYQLVIPNIGAYVLSAQIGNQLDFDAGTIELDKPSNAASRGPQLVHYTFDGTEGQTITTKLGLTQRGAGFSAVTLVDADGKELPIKRVVYDGNYNQVYILKGKAPYSLSFRMDGVYQLSITEGDKLTLDKGNFFIGDAEVDEVKADLGVQIVIYQLKLKAGETITTRLYNEFFDEYDLFDANGNYITPDANWYTRDADRLWNHQARYTVRDAGVYELAIPMAGKYTMRVTDGDELTVVKGNVFYNVQETDTLPNGKRYAKYTINAEEGQTISLELIGQAPSMVIADADGNTVYPGLSTSQTGYSLTLFELQGKAPYTLTLEPRGAYKLKISDTDTLNIDGKLPYDEEISNTPVPEGTPANAPKYPKRFRYDIDAQSGDQITIQFTEPKTTFATNLHVYDASMTDVLLNTNSYDSGKRLFTLSYTLTGSAPYQFWFDAADAFKITLNRGDLLTANLGSLTEGEPIDQQLDKPAVVALYTVNGSEGDIVSIALGRSGDPVFTNALDQPVLFLDQNISSQSSVYVFQLQGPGPYTLRFRPNQRYKLELTRGNTLIVDQGGLPINSAADLTDPKFKPVEISGKLDSPARITTYTIDGAKEDEVITLRLNARGSSLAPIMINSAGDYIDPELTVSEKDTLLAVYHLTGSAPYGLAFDAPNPYKISIDEGNTLLVDGGTLPTGILEEPYSNELPKTARIVSHVLDVAPGQLITLQVENSRKVVAVDLRDGKGQLIEPAIQDFQGGSNNVNIYLLSGSGPYTATFPVTGKYTASVAALNLLRVDKGIAPFATEVEDQLDKPGRVATYLVEGKRDQMVTIQLKAGNKPVAGEFRDANGKLWLPEYQAVQNNALFNVYRLGGPGPYDITFGGDQKYTIMVSDGNGLRADLGSIPMGEKVSNTLPAPAQTAVYSLDSQAGAVVSVALQVGGQAGSSSLYNADGVLLVPTDTVQKSNTLYSVYSLAGAAPYRLEFTALRQYNITVSDGNVLRADLGAVTLGEKISKTMPAPAQTGIYSVDAESGQYLSVQLQAGGKPADSTLFDADGKVLEPDAKLDKLNSTIKIYTLSSSGPYRLEFTTDKQYNLTVSAGNVLRADQGVIRFGNTATATLKQPAQAAIYTIDAQPGQIISVQLQNNNRPTDSELRDADGKLILPWGQVKNSSAAFSVYLLSGKAPYKITFLPTGRYSLILREGNFFVAQLGTIPFGQKITNKLPVPATTASYTINTDADQVISAQIVNRGGREFIKAKLINAEGEEIKPQTEVFDGTNTSTTVYTLTGSAPYTFQFEVTGQYDITFSRGDVTDPNFVPVGPQSVPQTP